MTKPSDPAFLTEPKVFYMRQPEGVDVSYGLTKREYFAAMAMIACVGGSKNGEWYNKEVIENSVVMADALIAELNNKTS